MTSFALKIVALISMFCDHFGAAFYSGQLSYLNLIGRIAFPIFAFQISEGYIHTKNIKKYFVRLTIFALISQVSFSLFVHKFYNASIFSLNVFFTLLLGLLAIYLYDYIIQLFNKNKENFVQSNKMVNVLQGISKFIGLIVVLLIGIIAETLDTDYGLWGVILVFVFYLFKNRKLLTTISFFILCALKYIESYILSNFNSIYLILALFTFLSIIFIDSYNGKQGKKIKYLLYIFYPLHLLLLYFIF